GARPRAAALLSVDAVAARTPRHRIVFDIGFSEIVVIAVVALVVLSPEKLPKTAATLGHLFGRLQRYETDVKADIRREIDRDELRKLQEHVQAAAKDMEALMTPAAQAVEQGVRGVESELTAAAGAGSASQASVPPSSLSVSGAAAAGSSSSPVVEP